MEKKDIKRIREIKERAEKATPGKRNGDTKMAKLEGVEYIIKPLDIVKGGVYKNFKGYSRTVLDVLETSDGTKVRYIDDTNTERTVKIDSFRQWVKKNYY